MLLFDWKTMLLAAFNVSVVAVMLLFDWKTMLLAAFNVSVVAALQEIAAPFISVMLPAVPLAVSALGYQDDNDAGDAKLGAR